MNFLSLKRRWNLSGFTYIQLLENQKVRHSSTLLISLITSNFELPIANGVFCITYQDDIRYKQKEITKKDIKKYWNQYGALWYSMYNICPVAKRLIRFCLLFSITQIVFYVFCRSFSESKSMQFCYHKRMPQTVKCFRQICSQSSHASLLYRHFFYLSVILSSQCCAL